MLPAAVRLLAVLLRVTPPVKVARPALLMVSQSVSGPVLPAGVVLKMRLPPHLPVASCMHSMFPQLDHSDDLAGIIHSCYV